MSLQSWFCLKVRNWAFILLPWSLFGCGPPQGDMNSQASGVKSSSSLRAALWSRPQVRTIGSKATQAGRWTWRAGERDALGLGAHLQCQLWRFVQLKDGAVDGMWRWARWKGIEGGTNSTALCPGRMMVPGTRIGTSGRKVRPDVERQGRRRHPFGVQNVQNSLFREHII